MHFVEKSRHYFRPKFTAAVAFIAELVKLLPVPFPRILMSATIRQKDVDRCTELLGNMQPNVMQGDLSRRDANSVVKTSGSSTRSLVKSGKKNFKKNAPAQHIYFTHSCTKAEGGLRNAAESSWTRLKQTNFILTMSLFTCLSIGKRFAKIDTVIF